MENYRDNLELNLKDFFHYIFKFWKKIVIFAVIGTLLGVGYSFICVDNTKVEPELSDEPVLTDVELQRVNTAVEAYQTYQKIYETVRQDINANIDKIGANGEMDKDIAEALKYKTEVLGMATSGQFGSEQSVYSLLSEDEKKVYNKLIGREKKEDKQVQSENESNFTVRNSLVGFIFGSFIMMFILAVKYLLSPMLKTEDDLRTAFKLPILGSVDKQNDEGLAVICSSIMALANTGRAKDILLCTSLSQGCTPDYISRIKVFLKEKEVSADSALNIISDPASIDKISRYDGIVFFESIGESVYENIAKEIELSENLGLKILGAVVVK